MTSDSLAPQMNTLEKQSRSDWIMFCFDKLQKHPILEMTDETSDQDHILRVSNKE